MKLSLSNLTTHEDLIDNILPNLIVSLGYGVNDRLFHLILWMCFRAKKKQTQSKNREF